MDLSDGGAGADAAQDHGASDGPASEGMAADSKAGPDLPPVTDAGFNAWPSKLVEGTWYEIPNTRLADHKACTAPACPPGSFKSIMGAWSGAAFDTKRQHLLVFGGGHADYAGNEIFAFDLKSLTWKVVVPPSLNVNFNAHTFETCGFYPKASFDPSTVPTSHLLVSSSGKTTIYLDPARCDDPAYRALMDTQAPHSRHSYNYLAYLPKLDAFCSFGGSALWKTGQAGHRHVDCFDLQAKRWNRLTTIPVLPPWKGDYLPRYGGFAIQHQDVVWLAGHGSSKGSLGRYDVTAASFNSTYYPVNPWGGWKNYKTPALHKATMLLYAVGGGQMLRWDLKDPSKTPVKLTPTGDTAVLNYGAPGMDYLPASQQLVAWRGGRDVYYYTPSTNTWVKRTGAGADPGAAQNNGTYGRFRYATIQGGVIVLANDVYSNVFIYKPHSQPQ